MSPVKKAIIPNKNDVEKQTLYQKRMNKNRSELSLVHKKVDDVSKELAKNKNPPVLHRIRNKMHISDPTKVLKHELDNLICYREVANSRVSGQSDPNANRNISRSKSSRRINTQQVHQSRQSR